MEQLGDIIAIILIFIFIFYCVSFFAPKSGEQSGFSATLIKAIKNPEPSNNNNKLYNTDGYPK